MSRFTFLSKTFSSENKLSSNDQQKLFEELLFLTLSRASRSDLDISSVEVCKIQQILKVNADLDISEKEIRVEGMSDLYEVAPLEKYVSRESRNLSIKQRYIILKSLFEVIGIDDNYGHTEADFFDRIANALRLRPIEMMGVEIDI